LMLLRLTNGSAMRKVDSGLKMFIEPMAQLVEIVDS